MSRRRLTFVLTAGLAAASLASGMLPSSHAAGPIVSDHLKRALVGGDGAGFPGAEVALGDADRRGPALAPLASALRTMAQMGTGVEASWTQYGTPLTLTRSNGFLATGYTGSNEQAARAFLTAHAGLYGLTAADVAALELVSDTAMTGGSAAHVVLLRQTLSGLRLIEDGLVAVSLLNGQVAVATGSIVPTAVLGALPSLLPTVDIAGAVVAAAKDAGINTLKPGDLTIGKRDAAGFTQVTAASLHQVQLSRLRVIATTQRGARLAWETNVTDVAGGRALAAISSVDALTGEVLLRRDAVDTMSDAGVSTAATRSIQTVSAAASVTPGSFQTAMKATGNGCSDRVAVTLAPGTRTLAVVAAAEDPSSDIVINVYRNGASAGSGDTATSPEVANVTFAPPTVASDRLELAICPYAKATAPYGVIGGYAGSDAAPGLGAVPLPGPLTDGTLGGPATWRAFASNPQLPTSDAAGIDDRYKVCSGPKTSTTLPTKDLTGCNLTYTDVSPVPYDVDPVTGLSTFTTMGNNALTSNAQSSSSLTPGAPFLPPLSPTRDYAPSFNDSWHAARCAGTSLVGPDRANIDAAIVNLFVGHNRVHDFAYRLGLIPVRGALQTSNYGQPGVGGDPELGNAQNAALSQTAFTAAGTGTGSAGTPVPLTGRNNANQITLQDGVPGITNQYLFQPVVGFYGPCADGDLDASIFLHEYTHAVSNRLIAGPDTGLSGQQGGSMGESWSDLNAVEYLNEFGLAGSRGEDPYSVGAYATGNKTVGIRDFNLAPSKNPLNYSDFGFDTTGPEVHADGEIWNAIQMTVREALVDKYRKIYNPADKALQAACALGRTTTGAKAPNWDRCPGNRRYITYMFDAMYMQANGAPSMVDMKNVELAAVLLRDKADAETTEDDYKAVADAFASRGLGSGSSSKTSADTDPVPSFASPTAANARVAFTLTDASTGKPVKGSVYVGTFQARATAIATTLGGSQPKSVADFVAGTYQFVVQAKGYGLQRFTATFLAGAKIAKTFTLQQNVASSTFGASAVGNDGAARLDRLLDDDEASNGAFLAQPVAGRTVTVALAGGRSTIDKVAVSSLHHPAAALPEGGTEVEGRFIGIRAFDLQASSDGGKTFTTVYSSPKDFFPGYAPRPTASNLQLRTITLSKPVSADHLRMVIRSNNCTGSPDFVGEKEADPTSPSDCTSLALNNKTVTVAELQVFKAAKK